MRLLHCTIRLAPAMHSVVGRTDDGMSAMGFFTELFVRPRPGESERLRRALRLLESMSPSDRADIGIKPADFPRIAREMARR